MSIMQNCTTGLPMQGWGRRILKNILSKPANLCDDTVTL